MSKNLFRHLAITILLVSNIFCFAQVHISGRVYDRIGTLSNVNISLNSIQDSTKIYNTVSDSDGFYSVNISQGKYRITYSHVGYKNIHMEKDLTIDSSMPNIALEKTEFSLQEVDIVHNRPTIKLSGSKILVNVEKDNILKSQHNIYDMLGKIPGISSNGKSAYIIGKGVPVYYLNGQKVADISEIEDLPIEQIKTVKIIKGIDVNYEESSSPVVDIITKSLGYGLAYNILTDMRKSKKLSQKYSSAITYNRNKLGLNFGFSYNINNSINNLSSNVETYTSYVTKKNQETVTHNNGKAYNIHGGINYSFNASSKLSLQYTGLVNNLNKRATDSIGVDSPNEKYSFISSSNDNKHNIKSHHFNLRYILTTKNKWNISFCSDYVSKKQINNNIIKEATESGNTKDVKYDQSSNWNIISGKINTAHSFGKYGMFNSAYSFSNTIGHSNIIYNESSLHDSKAYNRETHNSLSVNYELTLGYITLSSTLRYLNIYSCQRSTPSSRISFSHNYFLPNFSVSYTKGALSHSINYSLNTEFPLYSDMVDKTVYKDRYQRNIGNMFLKPEKVHDISYMFLYKFMYLSLQYSYIQNPIQGNFFSSEENPQIITAQVINFKKRHTISGLLNFRQTIKRWTPSATIAIMKSIFIYPGRNGTFNKDSKPVIMMYLNNDLAFQNDYTLSVQFNYIRGGYLQMLKMSNSHSLDISAKKSFLKKRLSLSLDIYDLFNKNHNTGIINLNNLRIMTRQISETRYIGLSLIYKFRENKETNNVNSAKEEMRRINLTD